MNSEPLPFPLNVLFISSEADPLIKVGGLGDVAGSLPPAISRLSAEGSRSYDIRVAIPFYPKLRSQLPELQKVASFPIETTKSHILAKVYESSLAGLKIYLISGEPIDSAPNVYGPDYVKDTEKFIFFSLACLKLPGALKWNLDILHANDWHTAVAVHQLPLACKTDSYLANARSILTLHNLPYMGTGAEEYLKKFKVNKSEHPALPSWARTLPLPMGLAETDRIVAVSPTYAKEILKPAYGCGLQDFLSTRKHALLGILNGLDQEAWDPSRDNDIPVKFGELTLHERVKNKLLLQKEFDLKLSADTPLLLFIGRLDPQKGVDIAIEAMHKIKHLPWQAILLGSGQPQLEDACRELQDELPEKVRAAITFDARLSRRMYAGGDLLLMPSRYEPCGLAQMIAMRYGCVPVVRATGGLADTVVNTTGRKTGTGFIVKETDAASFAITIASAITTYENSSRWKQIQLNGMKRDFSWTRSAQDYVSLYEELLKPSDEVKL